jgi:dCMP deaminase
MDRKIIISSLSTEAQNLIETWHANKKRVDCDRPSWDDYYLNLAHHVAKRSLDSQTQCGCVITNQDHQPLGFGYNSFIRGIDDSILPNVRKDKYPFMIHSELNAIFNCSLPPKNGIAYITGPPCPHCLQSLWQVGIREIVYGQNHTHMQQKTKAIEEILILLMQEQGLVYRGVDHVRNQDLSERQVG